MTDIEIDRHDIETFKKMLDDILYLWRYIPTIINTHAKPSPWNKGMV